MNTFFERNQLAAKINPTTQSTAANTGWVAVDGAHELAILIMVGTMVATSTFDVTFEQATDASGTGAKAITDAAGTTINMTALTAAGGDGSQVIAVSSLAEYLDVNNGYAYFRVTATAAVANVSFAVAVFAVGKRYLPVATTVFKEVLGP